MQRVTLILEGDLYEIPDGDADTPAFVEFCEAHGLLPHRGYNRAWFPGGDPCITAKDKYLIFLDDASTGYPFIFTEDDLKEQLKQIKRRPYNHDTTECER